MFFSVVHASCCQGYLFKARCPSGSLLYGWSSLSCFRDFLTSESHSVTNFSMASRHKLCLMHTNGKHVQSLLSVDNQAVSVSHTEAILFESTVLLDRKVVGIGTSQRNCTRSKGHENFCFSVVSPVAWSILNKKCEQQNIKLVWPNQH